MDPNYEGNSFPDVDFKPGADFEVDDTLFQEMKEDFLDFGIANNEYVYCSTELETQGRAGSNVDVENEIEIQKDDAAYEDVADSGVVSESNQPVKKKTRTEEPKVVGNGNEGAFEDKKKACQIPVVKTYNMRSKRLAVDDGKAEFAGKNTGGKGGQLAKRQKVEQGKTTKTEETSDEEEEDDEEDDEENEEENEDLESEDGESPQSKRRQVIQPKKGAKAKGKRKAKAAKVKKNAKGKAPPKKSSKLESEEEDEEDEGEDLVAKFPKRSKASKLKEKIESGKRKGRRKRKLETDSSEEEENENEEEEEEEDGDSESDEEAEVPKKSARTKQKRSAKGKVKQPAAKKKKPAKKSSKKAAPTSDSEATSSDNLPLQVIRKQNKAKVVKSGGNQKKVHKEESEENSTGEEDETENTQTGTEKGGHRDPILSALTKGSVVLTDDSASVCSNDDGTPGVRTSSRIKKPNRMYVTGSASGQLAEKTGAAAQKKEKQTKATDQQTANDVSETTDTDSLVIDTSPLKFQLSSVSGISKPQVSSSAEEKDTETEEPEKGEDDKRDNLKKTNELPNPNNQQTDEPGSSEGVKRSARLKHVEETNLEKFKALKAERERLEVKNDLQKRKSLEKVEPEMDKEEKPKQVTKEAVKPSVSATAIKNPCRGPNCGNGSLPGSVYCSDICIQNHAEESIQLIEQERQKSQPQRSRTETTVAISKSEERVVVFERKTGKLLTGPVAPTESTLLAWLKKHPTFEVLQPSHHSSSASSAVKKDKKPENKKAKEVRIPVAKEPAKTSTPGLLPSRDPEQPPHGGVREEKTKANMPSHTAQQPGPIADRNRPTNIHRELGRATPRDMHGESNYSRGGPDPARISIRNTLRETLLARANETDDVMLSGPEIKRLALDIEQELFGYYGEVNTKYKHKYRTLITHLKDPKNKGLFRKVLFGEVKASRLVRLSSENLGSRELAFWKDPSAKMAQENIFEPKPPKKVEFPLPPKSPFYDPSYDYLSSIIVDTTSNHGNHFFDINCKICTGKIPEPMYYEANKTSSGGLVSSKEDVASAAGTDAEPPVAAKLAKDDDHAPSAVGVSRDPRRSKAAINPDSSGLSVSLATSKSKEKAAILSPPNVVSPPVAIQTTATEMATSYRVGQVEPLVLWKGAIYTHDVSKVAVCAYLVSGSLAVLKEDLSDLIVISGRLPPDNVCYYLSHIKQSGSFQRDVAVLRFESAGGQNEDLYHQLFHYLHSRDRCGVVSGCSGPTVKDMYIVPVASGHGLPSVLLPCDGPGLSENHPNLLLGVILKHTSKRPSISSPGPVKTSALTKTWMYSERMPENKEERGPETQHHGNRHGTKQIEADVVNVEKQSSVEELAPKALTKAAVPSEQDDVTAAESSGTSDVDEDLSEVAQKDPIVSKYSKFEKKKSFRKPVVEIALDDEKPYDPFDDEEDKPYDPSSPEFVPTTRVVMATDTVSASKVASSSTGNLTSSNALLPNPTSSLGRGIAVTPPLKPVGGASNTTDMTTAMLTTLAAISTTNNTEEQRRLFAELTDKINEQKLHLDKERQDLKNEESLGFVGQASTSKRNNSDNLESSQKISSESLFQLLDGRAFAAKSGNVRSLSQTELSSSFGSASREASLTNTWGNLTADHVMKSLPAAAAASNLSQMPIDSAAIMNLARKRLAQKAGDSHHTAPKAENTSAELGVDAKKHDLSMPADDAAPNGNELGTTAKSGVETSPTFSCNLSVLPASIQQLLSGPSFENLKNIVANATGKKISDVDGSNAVNVEPHRHEKDAGTMANRFSDKELGLVRSRSDNTLSSEDLGRNGNYQARFPSNTHGDVDYRFQSDPSDVNSNSYEDTGKHWNLQLQTGSRVDPRTQSSHPPAFSMQKPTGPIPFRPSMQALLETPSDLMPRNSSEAKQPLLKTPQISGALDPSKPQPREMNQPPFPPFMQPPSFPSKLSRQSFPAEMQGHQMADNDDQQQQFQKGSLRSEVPRPLLLPDVPKPPFPPQLSRPPFPPGIQRQPFLPEPPRPPVMPDHLRAPVTSRNEVVLPSQTFGNTQRPSSGLLPIPSPGTGAGKGQTDSSGKGQIDYSSPSDKYFVPQSAGPRNFPKTDNESVAELSKPFLVGDILKQLDSTKTRQGSVAKTSSPSAVSGQNKPKISPQSSSEDANLRERKVLLPTPTTQSKQKSNDPRTSQNAAEALQEKKQENRESSENKKQEQKKSEADSNRAAVRSWSAKSDWETKKSEKANLSDDGAKSLQQIELELIPLPPTRHGDQSGCGAEDENSKEDRSVQGKPESKPDEDGRRSTDHSDKEKPSEGRRHSKQSPSELSRSRSGENGKFGAKKGTKDNSDTRAQVSDRGERRSRLQDRGRHSRDDSSRQGPRSKERPSSYHTRSSDRRSNTEQQRRFSRGRRRPSPLLDIRKRDGDGGLLIKERTNHENHNKTNQMQSSPIVQAEMKPSILGIPPLLVMKEAAELQAATAAIPSLLDMMGVSRNRVPQSRSSSELKSSGGSITSPPVAGSLAMKYCRDYKHGTDSDDLRDCDRRTTVPETASEQPFDSHGMLEMAKRREFDRIPDPRDHRRPILSHHYQVDYQDRRDIPIEMRDSGPGNAGMPPKRPLIDRPPVGDFHPPYAGEGDPYEGGEKFSRPGYRYRSGSAEVDEGINSRQWGETHDVSQVKGEPMHMHPAQSSQFPASLNFERNPMIHNMETNEVEGRLFNASAMKKSLLGDYPGMGQDPNDENPSEVRKEGSNTADEWHLQQSMMPEPYKTGGDGQQSSSLPPRPRFPRPMTGMIRPGNGPTAPQRHQTMYFDERGPRPRMPPPQFGGPHDRSVSESPPWRNPGPFNRQPENRGQPFLPSEGSDMEKKTLLPVPDASDSVSSSEMSGFPGPGPGPGPGPRPHPMDGPPGFMMHPGPGGRMPHRIPQHRHAGFSRGSRGPGMRPMVPPGDSRFRGKHMR